MFKNPINSQKELVTALLAGEFWPVMMTELPKLTRPGEAREAEKSRKKGGRGGGGGGRRRQRG
jgi:hypothetical protein